MSAADIKLLATRMARMCGGNQDHHYTADFKNLTVEKSGKLVPLYMEVDGPPTEAEYVAHLEGKMGLLSVPITKGGACRWGKIDIDVYGKDPLLLARKYAKLIKRHGLPFVVMLTKSGGLHLAYYRQHAMSAADMRGQLADWAALLNIKEKYEIFPKQDHLGPGEKGSGVNLPFFGGDSPATRNYAVDSEGNRLSVAQWLDTIEKMPASAVTGDEADIEGAAELLAEFWIDGNNRDDLNLEAGGTMLRAGLDTNIVQEILSRAQNIAADSQTHKSAGKMQADIDAGKRVPGFTKLASHIGQDNATELMRLIGHDSYIDPEPPFSTALVYDAGAFLALPLPEREAIITGLLFRQSIGEVYGWRGTGKTWFGLGLSFAVAQATKFLMWEVPQPRRVLYVDGEMPARDLQDRMRALLGHNEAPNKFMLMPSELFYQSNDSSLVINNPVQQGRFMGLLESLAAEGRAPEVIVFDNLSSLTAGIDENSTSEQAQLAKWFVTLRHEGYTVLFVHHSGKAGTQRGASGREDNLDLVIKLTSPEQLIDQTRMTMEFEKYRGKRPKPDVVEIELLADEHGVLQLASTITPARRRGEIEQKLWILRYLAENNGTLTRRDVAVKFEISKPTANEHVQKLIKAGWLSGASGPLTVTAGGMSKLFDLWPGEIPM